MELVLSTSFKKKNCNTRYYSFAGILKVDLIHEDVLKVLNDCDAVDIVTNSFTNNMTEYIFREENPRNKYEPTGTSKHNLDGMDFLINFHSKDVQDTYELLHTIYNNI